MSPDSLSNSALNRLTNRSIQAFLARPKDPKETPKLFDGGGLILVLSRKGTPSWRFKYLLGGKERSYTIGHYPAVSLEEARLQRDIERKRVKEGRDPVSDRKVRRATAIVDTNNTFANAASFWLAKKELEWKPIHFKISKRALQRDIITKVGHLPVGEITSSLMAKVFQPIVDRGVVDTAYKIRQHCNGIFLLAQTMGWCDHNPMPAVKEALPKRRRQVPIPAILELTGLGDVLRRAEVARLSPAVKMAHRLAAFSTARMGTVTLAEWSEFHLEGEQPHWLIPRSKMKVSDRGGDHKIILCQPIVRDLMAWRNLVGGEGYLFPTPTRNGGTKPISREAVEKAYRVTLDLKNKHTPHGWRSSFSTLARAAGFAGEVVEIVLDHLHDTDIVLAYDRGKRLPDQVKLMTWWGKELEAAQRGAALLPFQIAKVA